jgi:hypothetical protein
MKHIRLIVIGSFISLLGIGTLWSAERDATAAQAAATDVANDGLTPEEAAVLARPKNLPDFTKGDVIPTTTKSGPITWNVGPTGIIGVKNGGFAGDQVQVVAILPGSPADGKILIGDVIMGVAGKKFVAGGHLGVEIGNAIIKAEEEAGKGVLKMQIWRDLNWARRAAGKNVTGVNIDELFKQAEVGGELTEWEDEKQRKAAVAAAVKSEFPIDGVHTNMVLQLKVMGTYSDTSPWDCPVATRIREDAWKVVEAAFKPDKNGKTKAGWRDAIGLVASGKPEHRELVRNWVHKQKLCTDINEKVEPVQGGGMLSWHKSFSPLDMAIYYDATGDDYVLPQIRKTAIEVAMGQSGGGSWGHTFSFQVFNGGQLHGRCPGYGAMNNAGTRCFFLLTLAKKAGIKHPEIDEAIFKASRFFNTYVDKGCVPYGDHGPWPSDDSNGKNYGAAYAFYTLGMSYQAKYFSMHSAHAAFTPRGGHASPVLWQFTPLSSHISGQKAVTAAMRNMRWFYTIARRHDGSFVIQSEQEGVGAYGSTGESPTALYAMYHSLPLKQLITTGKDANTNCWMNDKELDQLLVSARSQMNDPVLLERVGKPWNERSTEDLIGWIGHFYPNMRRGIATELGKRFKAGEAGIVPKVTTLLESPDARVRDGACLSLVACGTDSTLGALSKLTRLLDDPAEFVRMGAIRAIASTSQPGDRSREEMLLKAAAGSYTNMSTDIANVTTAVRDILFAGRRQGSGASASKLTTDPFSSGLDKMLVEKSLERIITMDPGGVVPNSWSKDTVLQLAGPIVYVADELQVMDCMFGGARTEQGLAVLGKYGYREVIEGDASLLIKRSALERGVRNRVKMTMRGDIMSPGTVRKYRGACQELLGPMKQLLQDDPLATFSELQGKIRVSIAVDELIEMIESDKAASPLPSIGGDVAKMFQAELAKASSSAERIKLCQAELVDPARKNDYHKTAAMVQLVELMGAEAIDDLAAYFGHNRQRVRNQARKLTVDLLKGGTAPGRLIEMLKTAGGEKAAGILAVMTEAGLKSALEPARQALNHKDAVVRKAAVQSVFALGGEKSVPEVFAFMAKATDPIDLWGCELALVSCKDNAALAKRIRDEAIALMPGASAGVRRSLSWVLGQFGGPESLATLQKAASTTKDDADLNEIIISLSYSPDRAADKVLLALAKQDKRLLGAVVAQSVRRMVGPNGVGDVTDAQRMDFAEPILAVKHDPRFIAYLGKIHTGRSLKTLYEVMKSGSAALAAPAIISAADSMEKAPEAERAIAAEALTSVIEYIEVTKLRGGYAAQSAKEDNYAGWKTIQAEAGRALLKVHKPKAAPIPAFNDKDLDL